MQIKGVFCSFNMCLLSCIIDLALNLICAYYVAYFVKLARRTVVVKKLELCKMHYLKEFISCFFILISGWSDVTNLFSWYWCLMWEGLFGLKSWMIHLFVELRIELVCIFWFNVLGLNLDFWDGYFFSQIPIWLNFELWNVYSLNDNELVLFDMVFSILILPIKCRNWDFYRIYCL